jgi:hypothetical protein
MHGSIRPSVSMSTAEPPEVVPGSRPMALVEVIPGACGWGRSARYSGAFAIRLAVEEGRGSRHDECWNERGRSWEDALERDFIPISVFLGIHCIHKREILGIGRDSASLPPPSDQPTRRILHIPLVPVPDLGKRVLSASRPPIQEGNTRVTVRLFPFGFPACMPAGIHTMLH